MDETEKQQIIDAEHLRLLRIGYFLSAAVSAFAALFGLLYLVLGVIFLSAATRAPTGSQPPPPEFVGWVFGILGFGFASLALVVAALQFYAGQCLKQRRSRLFCMILAAITSLNIPFGTLLGVWTFMVLTRPSVIALFEGGQTSNPS